MTKTDAVAQISEAITNIGGSQFVGLTYRTKGTQELARYTINVGASYHSLVEKSLTELEILTEENKTTWDGIETLAAVEVTSSLNKTLLAHAEGAQNEDYTKIGQYVPLGNGLSLNSKDGSLQLFGVLQSKVVLEPGEHKIVNSKPLTIAKNKLKKLLPIDKFREFCIDLNNLESVRINGNTIELNTI